MRDSEKPVVSLCIPTHDDEAVIADALRSALRQDYAPLEIVVVDNCSTDGTWDLVSAIAAGDSRVRTFRNAENIGMARNFNACIAAAAGEFVLILCADDLLEDACAGLLAGALVEHPNAVLAACGRTFTDASLRRQGIYRARVRKEEVQSHRLMRECFAHGNRIGEPSAVMFRRRAATRGFDPNYSQVVDLEMWFHLLGQGAAILLPQPCSIIRQHGEQVTRGNIRSGRIVSDKQLLFRKYAEVMEGLLNPLEKLAWDARMASSVARTRAAGGRIDLRAITELFYPRIFALLLQPLAGLGWKVRDSTRTQRL